MSRQTIYESWDLTAPRRAPQTRLYHLAPIGVGTPLVESLTGYLSRLAKAHAVSSRALVLQEIGYRVSKTWGNSRGYENTTFLYDAHILNGMGSAPKHWVRVTEELTGRVDLGRLTMSAWKQVFSGQDLIRLKRAWCPFCYEEWRTQEKDIYEPLLWSIRLVSMCPLHARPLLEVCPYCERSLHVLCGKSNPGYCSRCGRWLGIVNPESPAQSGNLEYALWAAKNTGTLLANAPSLPAQARTGDLFRKNLQSCIVDLAEGNQNLFVRATGVHYKRLPEWLLGDRVPELQTIAKLCHRLELPVSRFLIQLMTAGDPEWERARSVVHRYRLPRAIRPNPADLRLALQDALCSPNRPALSEIAAQLGFKTSISLRRHDPAACIEISKRYWAVQTRLSHRNRTTPADQIRERLEAALTSKPPPSVLSVAHSLGYRNSSTLHTAFPELCRSLAATRREHDARRRAEAGRALGNLVREDLPPTLKEAAQHAGLSRVATIREKFHDLHHNLVARISERRRKQLEQIRSSLDAAVTQEPAVSPSYLAQQVGKCPGHLHALFPDLWRTISLRWCDFKSGEFNRKQEHLRQEVRRIVLDLYSAGVYPSRERVQALIAESPLRSTYIVRRELVRVKRELEERELLQANQRSPMQIG